MADLTFDNNATERRASTGLVPGKGDAHTLKVLVSATVEIPATASGQTFLFGRISSNVRLSGRSKIYWDDLTTTGSPTFDLGLGSVNANITNDPDALSNGHVVTSAGSADAIAGIENYGLPAWDLVSTESSDPGGEFEVYGTIKDAATVTLTGTVTVELLGYFD